MQDRILRATDEVVSILVDSNLSFSQIMYILYNTMLEIQKLPIKKEKEDE